MLQKRSNFSDIARGALKLSKLKVEIHTLNVFSGSLLLFISRQNLSSKNVLLFRYKQISRNYFSSFQITYNWSWKRRSHSSFIDLGFSHLSESLWANTDTSRALECRRLFPHFSSCSLSASVLLVNSPLNYLHHLQGTYYRKSNMEHPYAKLGQGQSIVRAPLVYFCYKFYSCFMVLIIKRHSIDYFACSSYAHRDEFFINFHNTLHIWRILLA